MASSIKLRGAPSGPELSGGAPGDVCTLNSDGSCSWQPGGGAGAVESVFGRDGVVVAESGDYDASEIVNDSPVEGSSVADALGTLNGFVGQVSVLSPFVDEPGYLLNKCVGGPGVVYSGFSSGGDTFLQCTVSSDINNLSTVVGTSVTDALNTLKAALAAQQATITALQAAVTALQNP